MRSQPGPDPQRIGRSSRRRRLVRRRRRQSVNGEEEQAQWRKSPLLADGRAAEASSLPAHPLSLQREDGRKKRREDDDDEKPVAAVEWQDKPRRQWRAGGTGVGQGRPADPPARRVPTSVWSSGA